MRELLYLYIFFSFYSIILTIIVLNGDMSSPVMGVIGTAVGAGVGTLIAFLFIKGIKRYKGNNSTT